MACDRDALELPHRLFALGPNPARECVSSQSPRVPWQVLHATNADVASVTGNIFRSVIQPGCFSFHDGPLDASIFIAANTCGLRFPPPSFPDRRSPNAKP